MQLGRAWDWNHPGLLGQNPSQRDLSRRCLFLLRELADHVNYGLIRFSVLGREARHGVAEIRLVELRIFFDRSSQEALAQRAEWNKSDPKLFQCRQNCLFRLAPPKRVLALERGDRLDRVRAADDLHSCLGESEVLHLALLNQVLHGPSHIFDRNIRVYAVLIKQIDDIRPEALERGLGHFLDMHRAAIEASLLAVGELKPKFRCNRYLASKRNESFADEFFIRERAIYFGGIEKRNPAFNSRTDHRDPLLFIDRLAVAEAHSHAAESNGRYFQWIAFSKFALLHCCSFQVAALARTVSACYLRR